MILDTLKGLLKPVTTPILPLSGSFVDAFPFVIIFILLFIATMIHVLRINACMRERIRLYMRIVSTVIFFYFIYQCLCIVKMAIFGLRLISYNDLLAFSKLWLIVVVIGFTFINGRVFCGYICPLGFVQEIIGKYRIKLYRLQILFGYLILLFGGISIYLTWPSNEFIVEYVIAILAFITIIMVLLLKYFPYMLRWLVYIKYIALLFYIGFTVLGVYFGDAWCPLYGLEYDYPAVISLLIIIALSFIDRMPWCRYMCPTGLFLTFTSRISHFKINPVLDEVCPIGAFSNGKYDDTLCIWCRRCEH